MNSNEILLLSTISTGLMALIGLCIRYCYLSKCVSVKFCGIEIKRDAIQENKAVEITRNNNHNQIQNQNSLNINDTQNIIV